MKKLLNVLMLALAMNFIAVAGGIGWLYSSGHVDKQKVLAIKAIVFPPPASQPGPQTNSPSTSPGQPKLKLEELLGLAATRPAPEQVEFLQRKIDSQVLQLDERERQLHDLQIRVDLDRKQVQQDRQALDQERTQQQKLDELAKKQAADKGFQDTLKLYMEMTGKQAKQIFMTLDDDTVVRYLRAMPSRDAIKIIKEFKTDQEVARLQPLLEKMRQASTQPALQAADAGGPASTPGP